MPERIAVIGGGISGLSAAYFAIKKGFSVELFESMAQLGGLASSFDWNGLTIERFYHFICRGDRELVDLASELGISSQIRFRTTKTGMYYKGRYFPFSSPSDLILFSPLSFSSRMRFGLNIINSKYRHEWEPLDRIPAKEWLIQKLGKKAYAAIWKPLLRIKFENLYDQISAAWVWHRIHRVAASRKGFFSKEKMGYFSGGTQTLFNALENRFKSFGGEIHLNSEIIKIERNKNVYTLTTGSKHFSPFNRIIFAVPLPQAATILHSLDSSYSRTLLSIDYVGVVCGVFKLRNKVTDAFWLNINDPRIAVNGFIEYTNLNPLEGAGADKIIYVPFYMPLNNTWYSLDQESLMSEFYKMIQVVNPNLTASDLVAFKAFRSPYAQAIYTTSFKQKMLPHKTPIENVYLLDATQLYPTDRVLSALIGQADKLIIEHFLHGCFC